MFHSLLNQKQDEWTEVQTINTLTLVLTVYHSNMLTSFPALH